MKAASAAQSDSSFICEVMIVEVGGRGGGGLLKRCVLLFFCNGGRKIISEPFWPVMEAGNITGYKPASCMFCRVTTSI